MAASRRKHSRQGKAIDSLRLDSRGHDTRLACRIRTGDQEAVSTIRTPGLVPEPTD